MLQEDITRVIRHTLYRFFQAVMVVWTVVVLMQLHDIWQLAQSTDIISSSFDGLDEGKLSAVLIPAVLVYWSAPFSAAGILALMARPD